MSDQSGQSAYTFLLTEVLTALNVAKNNIAIYPEKHPIVEQSFSVAYECMQKLLQQKNEITIASAKNSLIFEGERLDIRLKAFEEFAKSLNNLNIAFITFTMGLTADELDSFHRFLLTEVKDETSEDLQYLFNQYNFDNIKAGFIDYSAFKMAEEDEEETKDSKSVWEEYIAGLLQGNLMTDDIFKVLESIPPEKLAELLNVAVTSEVGADSCDRVINEYVSRTLGKSMSAGQLQKILTIVVAIRPDLKQSFLKHTVHELSDNTDMANISLLDMPGRDLVDLLSSINEHMVSVPVSLRNVLDQFSRINPEISGAPVYQSSMAEDDILLSPDLTIMLKEDSFRTFVSESYDREMQRLISFDGRQESLEITAEFEKSCTDEYIETDFNHLVLELALSNFSKINSTEDVETFSSILAEQMEQFLSTGQYETVTKTLNAIHSCTTHLSVKIQQYFHSEEFIASVAASFCLMGRNKREAALVLCNYYGSAIVPYLLEELIAEESSSVRKFIISLLGNLGEVAMPEVIRKLSDKRWFVVRNMLFILLDHGNEKLLNKAKPYCTHENPKVSFTALRCMLKAGDGYGIDQLRKHLGSDSGENRKRAVELAGVYMVKPLVPELLSLLNRKSLRKSQFDEKILVVKALGQIADKKALDALKEISASKSFFFKEHLNRLKFEVKKALQNYSAEGKG